MTCARLAYHGYDELPAGPFNNRLGDSLCSYGDFA